MSPGERLINLIIEFGAAARSEGARGKYRNGDASERLLDEIESRVEQARAFASTVDGAAVLDIMDGQP